MLNFLRRSVAATAKTLGQTYERRALVMRRRRAAQTLKSFGQPMRLHLGCGPNYLSGWVNLDGNRELPRLDLCWNLDDGLPVADASCQRIYSEHVLEHLPIDRAVVLLRECRRALAQRGVMRIAMPSLENIVAKYASPDWKEQDWLKWPAFQHIATRAEMINVSFRWWGHQWLYDREELHRRLAEAGFHEIADVEWGVSRHDGLSGLETRRDSLLICEASGS